MVTVGAAQSFRSIHEALQASVSSGKRAAISVVAAVAVFVLLVLSSFPEYAYQMVRADISLLPTAVSALTVNLYHSGGAVGIGLVAVYALLTGPALVSMYLLIRTSGIQALTSTGSLAPAVLVGSCASCGAGLLGLLGLFGVFSVLPFGGNGVRALGIGLLLFYFVRTGDPETCDLR